MKPHPHTWLYAISLDGRVSMFLPQQPPWLPVSIVDCSYGDALSLQRQSATRRIAPHGVNACSRLARDELLYRRLTT